jgi:hypothetical protein
MLLASVHKKFWKIVFGGYRPMRKFVGGAKRSMSWESFIAAF